MSAILMDGKALSQKVLRKIEQQCKKRAVQRKREVSLAVVLVGEDPASQIYVRNLITIRRSSKNWDKLFIARICR